MGRIDDGHVQGLLRGAVGGLAGVVAMDLFFRAARAIAGGSDDGEDGGDGVSDAGSDARDAEAQEREAGRQNGSGHALDDISVAGEAAREDEAATEAMGRVAYEAAIGHEPSERTKERLGQAVHWGYGILLGSVYGALRPHRHTPDLTGGLGYGTAAWLLGDEIMVPLMGLSKGPTAHRWSEHATALGAHLVYGAATSAATQALKRVM